MPKAIRARRWAWKPAGVVFIVQPAFRLRIAMNPDHPLSHLVRRDPEVRVERR